MKARIIKPRQIMSIAGMWYNNRVGELIEVENDPDFPDLFATEQELKGKLIKHHIYKEDCEILTDAG